MPEPIAFVTFREFPALSDDDRLAVDALEQKGLQVQPAIWDDAQIDWAAFSAVVLRSCWDYHLRPRAFAKWIKQLEDLEVRVWNPTEILRWNMDKLYLSDLEAAGIPVAPSVWLPQGAKVVLDDLLERKGWEEAVIKPTISAGADHTQRVTATRAEGVDEDVNAMLAQGGVLVQPFLDEVQSQGEWSLIFFDKRYSHAVLKRPKEEDFRVQWRFGGSAEAAEAAESLVEQAQRVLDEVDEPLLYARVDGVEREGKLLLMELELIEPYLFFGEDEGAASQFASVVSRYLEGE